MAVVSVITRPAYPLVNPSLQPMHLYDRYNSVLGLRVTSVDYDNRICVLAVTHLCKGRFAGKKVTVALGDGDAEEAFDEVIYEGQTIVAYIGKNRRNHEKDLLFYPGDGRWQVGILKSVDDLSEWLWTEDLGPEEMFGTFNGHADRLVEMMMDCKDGLYYFPARPFTRFGDDLVIDKFEAPLRGVALYDIDGDGDLDIYACCEKGNRAYVQSKPLVFTDSTDLLGLAGIRGVGVSFADVDADGDPDLLVDGVIFLARGGKSALRFTVSELLPDQAAVSVKSSAFVEINGDGFPDVVVSGKGRGLSVFLNQAAKGELFTDATAALGLDTKECGKDGNGFFSAGDFNDDNRTDLFYAVKMGLLLTQDETGCFKPVPGRMAFDFKTDGEVLGLTGAGCFTSLWRPDSADIVFSSESNINFVVNVDGRMQEMSSYGNEITESSFRMLAVIAEDLNVDGNVDIYAASRSVLPNMFYMNRGYGSFMTPHKYDNNVMPGKGHQRGAWGVAAGDVNSDGANDLLLGGLDGSLVLMINNTLVGRQDIEHPTYHQQKLKQTSILTARLKGTKGVLGSKVTLADSDGRVVAERRIGSNIATGCRGPDEVNLAVREPGQYVLTVFFSDGNVRKWPVDLAAGERHKL